MEEELFLVLLRKAGRKRAILRCQTSGDKSRHFLTDHLYLVTLVSMDFPLLALQCRAVSCHSFLVDNPVTLPCGHSFCRQCLQSTKCSRCNRTWEFPVEELQINTDLEAIVRWYKKSHRLGTWHQIEHTLIYSEDAEEKDHQSVPMLIGSVTVSIRFGKSVVTFFLTIRITDEVPMEHTTAVNLNWTVEGEQQ